MKKHLFFLIVIAAVFCWSSAAFAQCQCKNTRDRDESYRTAAYVFYGEAVEGDDGPALKVLENYKGTRTKRTHPIGDAEDCPFSFEVGKKYMVFGAKGEGKREVVVDSCGATTQLDHEPITVFVWSLAEELAFRTPRRAADRHRKAWDQITNRAVKKLKWAAGECDKDVWKGKGEAKARMEARFDVEPDGKYSVELVKYETPDKASADITKCLEEKLAEDDFKSFPGGRVSVAAYWIIDRLDASFGEDRSSATVLPFKSEKHLLE